MGHENGHNGRNTFASQFIRNTVVRLKQSPFIPLPYTYNFSDRPEVDNTLLTSLSGFDLIYSDWTSLSLQDGNLADSNSFTPTGVTKIAAREGGQENQGYGFSFPKDKTIDPTLTGLRWASLAYRPSPGIDPWAWRMVIRNATQTEQGLGADADSQIYVDVRPDINPDQARIVGYWETTSSDDSTLTNMTPSANARVTRWHWMRSELNFATNTVVVSMVRCQDNATINSLTFNINATGQALGHVPTGIKEFCVGTAASYYFRHAGFWLGTLTDDWPTTTLPSTTEDH